MTIPASDIVQLFEKEYDDVIHYLGVATLTEEAPEITVSWEHHGYRWFTMEELLKEPQPENVDLYFSDVMTYLHSVK